MMTFTWGPVVNVCPSLLYHIETNCGIILLCPENTTATTITCLRDTTIASNECLFAVRAGIMYGSNRTIIGTESSISLRLSGEIKWSDSNIVTSYNVNLTACGCLNLPLVPGVPVAQAIPYYSHSNQHLIYIHTSFNKTVPSVMCGKHLFYFACLYLHGRKTSQ